MSEVKKLFTKDGKELKGHIWIDGVVYVSTKTKGLRGCKECDCGYASNGCRLGSLLCKIPYSECYKVGDESKKVKNGGIYKIEDKRYYATDGHCKECSFYNPTGCQLENLTCTGHIPLKRISEGGM